MKQGTRPASSPAADSLRQITREVIQLSASDAVPTDFFRELLTRAVVALAAPHGAVWGRTPTGEFERLCRQNPAGGPAELEGPAKTCHEALLRAGLGNAEPAFYPAPAEGDAAANDHPFAFGVLFVPILVADRPEALIEIWLEPDRQPQAIPGMLQFLSRLADLSAVFLLRHAERTRGGQEEVWERLEGFSRRIHDSLHPTEVAFLVANEGRQLAGCDRLSVALRRGKSSIEAVSGVEKVDPRSNLVRRMRRLCDRVLDWGEPLVYRGQPDRTLPPEVLRELDEYLEECHSKLLVVLPLRTERERKKKTPPHSALICECFEATTPPEQLLGRLEVVGRHAVTALANAATYRATPLKFLWWPIARVQEGLGGKSKAITAAVATLLVIALFVLVFLPYPLKMDARGQLLPENRRWVYSPVDGTVVRFEERVEPGAEVGEHQTLVLMYDVQLESKLVQLRQEMTAAQNDAAALAKQLTVATTEAERLRLSAEKKQKESLRDRKYWELKMLRERTDADDARPGYFWLRSPMGGTLLNWDFRENLTNKQVRPSEPILRIGDKNRDWEVELKIPQKHVGQVVRAFPGDDPKAELDVDLLVTSEPTRIYRGKLRRTKIAGEANPAKDEVGEAEPVVLASIRIAGPDIAPEDQIPPALLVSGTEVHAKIRCGDRPMVYSLFYGVWEFVFERVIFFF